MRNVSARLHDNSVSRFSNDVKTLIDFELFSSYVPACPMIILPPEAAPRVLSVITHLSLVETSSFLTK